MRSTELREVFFAYGHANILATHRATLEFTKDTHLSKKGDCIIAVAASKALADLSPKFKANMRKPNAKLTVLIEAGEISAQVHAYGARQLSLVHNTDTVVRKSDYINSRTLAVRADKAAIDLPRTLVEKLKSPQQRARITLTVDF